MIKGMMKLKGFVLIVICFVLYNIIPNYYYRNKDKKTIKVLNTSLKKIALTFDDGPDPIYTEMILDILKKNNVKATFFLVADKALKNKEIVERMIQEGHGIGLHSLCHKSAWLSFPWQTAKDFEKSIKIFNELRYNIRLFRPPWGTFNLVVPYYAKKYDLKVVLWSIEAKDWSKNTTVDQIKERIYKKVKSGDIIVLHDSNGAKGAPKRTIDALEELIPNLIEEGYEFVLVDQQAGVINE
ncbi:polysaccharide deacetylase family protein [Inediibacterium massiliense]|uniref:polysaccharide deacetylase family protein n=1 Tax=Inediibacterium massiliense TaxID=1658111 RepID=UPI0006B4A16B|nr:polysaccharide deacetylase family protein [Inediibacterium massiliense]